MRALALVLSFLAGAVLTACRDGRGSAESAVDGSVSIGLLLDTLKEERWQRDRDLFADRAAELGATVSVRTADADDARQLRQANELLDGGARTLVVVPHDGEVAAAIVEAAAKRRVPVVAYDRLIRNSALDLYVSYDSHRVGELQARYLLERAPRGNYTLIGGSPTDDNARQIREGHIRVLQPAVDRGDVRIVLDQWAREWLPSEAYRHTQHAIQLTERRLAAVVAPNDATAGAAVQALQEAGLAGKVLVSGQDADLAALQRIIAGTQAMTVYKPIAPLARRAAEVAVSLARGRRPGTSDTVHNGRQDVPAILLPPVAVDETNMAATVIRDRFQRIEDVYRYVPKERWPDRAAPAAR